jgi:D-arabinose 1-dehydrogenase-like Zn-dependent alcohol dehydrogenase
MMKAMQVQEANGPFVLVEVPIPEPAEGQIRIKVAACGICHSDAFVKTGAYPGLALPRIPGHEVAGVIDKVGPGVKTLQVGQRVGVGWHGGHCFTCDNCRRGDFINCGKMQVCGIAYDGGYAEYMVAPWEAAARIPDELSHVDAAPLLCAGITTFNSLRNAGVKPGCVVAVQGIGGLGHLAIQFAKRMGFRVVALSRGADKEALARELGAHHYIDGKAQDTVAELKKLGGADLILCTAPSGAAIASVVPGLSSRGKVLVVAAAMDPIQVNSLDLLSGKMVQGWPSGSSIHSEDTLNFSTLTDVRPMIETFPLEQANEAFAKVMDNTIRFRAVLNISSD